MVMAVKKTVITLRQGKLTVIACLLICSYVRRFLQSFSKAFHKLFLLKNINLSDSCRHLNKRFIRSLSGYGLWALPEQEYGPVMGVISAGKKPEARSARFVC